MTKFNPSMDEIYGSRITAVLMFDTASNAARKMASLRNFRHVCQSLFCFFSNSDYAHGGRRGRCYHSTILWLLLSGYSMVVVIIIIVRQRTGTLVLAGLRARTLKLTSTWHPTVLVNQWCLAQVGVSYSHKSKGLPAKPKTYTYKGQILSSRKRCRSMWYRKRM